MNDNYQELVAGTTIDPRSLLSTDYFNHFNEVIILLSMLPDMPEMLDEIDQWKFHDYRQHFAESGLTFAPLAITLYDQAPADVRSSFEKLAEQMRALIVESRVTLRHSLENGDMPGFAENARLASMQLQGIVDAGGAIVHGHQGSLDQSAIDNMF